MGTSNMPFNATNDKYGLTTMSRITDSITKLYVRVATVTTGCTIEGRIETVGADGLPSGTLWSTTTNGTVAIADTDDNLWKTITLTSSASLNTGDRFAIVVTYSSGSTPNLNFLSTSTVFLGGGLTSRLLLSDAGAAYTNVGAAPIAWEVIVEYSGGIAYVPGCFPFDGSTTQTAFNSGSSPDEWAMRFQVPVPMTVAGARLGMANVAAGADFTVSLWDASGTTDAAALAQKAIDGDNMLTTTADGVVEVIFPTAYQIAANTTYYLGVRADTANNIAVIANATPSGITGSHKATPGGDQLYKATRAWTAGTAGAWTTDSNNIPAFSLLVSKLGDDAGGAGSIGDFGIPG